MPKLSLCMIIKPTDDEAKLLERCLKYVAGQVDEICITQAGQGKNKAVSEAIKAYGGKESFFKWVNDFSEARNYNFSQATGDYIFWLDADDVVKGGANIRGLVESMEKNKIECVAMNYLYDFDENKNCTVKHIKTRIVKKGSVKWVGAVHEDFENIIETNTFFTKDVEVLHIKDSKRTEDSSKRNLEIAESEMKKHPEDPRSLWLAANANWGVGKTDKAIEYFERFVNESQSEDEKYVAYLNLSSLKNDELDALKALSLMPTIPNAYHRIAEIKFNQGKYQKSVNFTELGLQLPVPETEIVVYNPRDYDYNPLMLMMKAYWKLGKTKKAVEIIEEMVKMFPNDQNLKEKHSALKEELGEVLKVEKYLEKAKKIKDKVYLKKYLDGLPEEVKEHPEICVFRNENFVKETSSGKDLVYYCGFTQKVWNPEIAMKDGVGGSEEAVVNLSKELAKKGWNVTVYNNCGHGGVFEGVTYKPFWSYNYRDKQDVTIFWRHPKPVDYVDERAGKVFIDMHDVLSDSEFTEERLKKITKVMVKTNAHRVLFPSIPDEKVTVIPNGISQELFENKPCTKQCPYCKNKEIERIMDDEGFGVHCYMCKARWNDKINKNPYLILNTSSADRHLDATLDVFEELIKRQPDKPWKLAWYYGWGTYDTVHAGDKEMMAWKEKQVARYEKLRKEGRFEGGVMLGHKEIAEKYLEAGIFLYPTQFYEVHCISAVKAQLANCKMVTSDFAALKETSKYSYKCHTDGEKWGVENTFGDTKNVPGYVYDIIEEEAEDHSYKVKEEYNWLNVSNQWNENICQ